MTTYDCPHCHKQPTVSIDRNKYVYQCLTHGHMAIGSSIDTAIRYWNRYIQYIITGDISNSVRYYGSDTERAVFRGLYGIYKGEL